MVKKLTKEGAHAKIVSSALRLLFERATRGAKNWKNQSKRREHGHCVGGEFDRPFPGTQA